MGFFFLGKVLNGVIPTFEFYLDKPNRIQEKLLYWKSLLLWDLKRKRPYRGLQSGKIWEGDRTVIF